MTATERYLEELGRALHTRGRARDRLLAECSEHLADAAASHGDDEAVRRFGDANTLARSFDAEIAARRGMRATATTTAGVLAVGASTLAVLHGAATDASAVTAWAVIFFAGAQAAGVCTVLAVLRVAAMRHLPATVADVALLVRRNGAALAFSAMTLFAAAAAVPGHAAAWTVLTGPVVAVIAAIAVLRSRSLARKIDGRPVRTVRAPLADLFAIAHRAERAAWAAQASPAITLLAPTAAIATVAAFAWDHLDHGTVRSSLTAAAVEAALTIVGFVCLGPALGLLNGSGGRGRRTAA